jgi:hypothetical protein
VESRLLAMADRLFDDFDDLPVKAVFDAISAARTTLRLQNTPATPDSVERLARSRLSGLRAA